MVLLPAVNKAAAETRAALLKAAGIKDIFIVDSGPQRFAISLGVFRTEDAANAYRADVAAKGFSNVQAGARQQTVVATMLVIRDPRERLISRLRELAPSYPGTEARSGPARRAADAPSAPPAAWGRSDGGWPPGGERWSVTLLTAAQSDAINAEVARIEARTGVEIVAVVTAKSSDYPQIPWKAFALGVSVAAAVLVLADVVRPDWPSSRGSASPRCRDARCGRFARPIHGVRAGASRDSSSARRDAISKSIAVPANCSFATRSLPRTHRMACCCWSASSSASWKLLPTAVSTAVSHLTEWRVAIDSMAPPAATEGPAAALWRRSG